MYWFKLILLFIAPANVKPGFLASKLPDSIPEGRKKTPAIFISTKHHYRI